MNTANKQSGGFHLPFLGGQAAQVAAGDQLGQTVNA